MNIKQITPEQNYTLLITAEDGRKGIFDVKPYLNSPVFKRLLVGGEFKKVKNGKYFIEWECGADLCADTIEAKLKII